MALRRSVGLTGGLIVGLAAAWHGAEAQLLDQQFHGVTVGPGLVLGTPTGASRQSLSAAPQGTVVLAAPGGQADATPVPVSFGQIIGGNGGVRLVPLPAWPTGLTASVTLLNSTTDPQFVYPPSGGTINGLSLNEPATLGPGALGQFQALGSRWFLVGPGPLPQWTGS